MNCDHEELHVTLDHKCRQVVNQCRLCGEKIGSALPHKDYNLGELPLFDHEFRELMLERRREIAIQEQQAKQRAFEDKREDRVRRYHGYLLSDAWRAKRIAVIRRENGICQGCKTERITEVHHLSYDNIGDELLFQLVGLCASCHERAHKNTQAEFYGYETI